MPAFADIMEGNFAVAIDPYREMLEMDPSNPMARLFYLWVLILNRRTEEVPAILAAFPASQRDTIPGRMSFFLAMASERKALEAQAFLSPEIEAVAKATDVFPRFLAQGFALAGIPELAMFWLDVAIRRGFINYPFLACHDPSFMSLRSQPRFVALLDVARAMWESFEP
jgi:non-specific serine/threonine protein kinase